MKARMLTLFMLVVGLVSFGVSSLGGNAHTATAAPVITGSWTTKAPMPAPRDQAAAVEFGGKVYLIGGGDSTGPLSTVRVYDPQTDSWSTRTSMPTAKFFPGAAVIGSKIYVVGSDTLVYAYDPAMDSWTNCAPIPQSPAHQHGIGVVGGKLYVAHNDQWLYQYDPATDVWTAKTPMPVQRDYISSFAVLNDKIYAIGGSEQGHVPSEVSRVDIYNPATDSWQIGPIPDMPTARTHLARTSPVINGKIYAIGGWDGYSALSSVEVYDSATNSWSSEAPMPTARYYLALALVGTDIYAIGGNWGGGGGNWQAVNERFSVGEPAPTDWVRLTTNPYSDSFPAWSPDGSLIAWSANSDDWHRAIWVMNSADGSAKTQLTFGVVQEAPDYSPDGSKLVFQDYYNDSRMDIVVKDLATGTETVVRSTGYNVLPRWSPDGTKILLESTPSLTDTYHVYTMNADGSNVTQLTSEGWINEAADWSPDGLHIAFSSDRAGSYRGEIFYIYVMDADGTNVVQIALGRAPVWSPDGTRLAYGLSNHIHVMQADGTGDIQVTTSNDYEFQQTWSPDGDKLAFAAFANGNRDIYTVDVSDLPGLTYSISGHVRDTSDYPISGVTISATGGYSATTDAYGAYTIAELITGTYTLTPTLTGWAFSPTTLTIVLPPSATGQDFQGSPDIYLPLILCNR